MASLPNLQQLMLYHPKVLKEMDGKTRHNEPHPSATNFAYLHPAYTSHHPCLYPLFQREEEEDQEKRKEKKSNQS